MKNMKKFVSLLLAVVMVMAMTMTTFAEEATSKLTIATKAGHTYKVYQMLVGDVSGLTAGENGTNSATLANVTKGANLNGTVAEFDSAIKTEVKDADGNVVKDDKGNTVYAYLTGAALGDAAAAKTTGKPTEVKGTGSDVSIDVENGYYVIVDTFNDEANFTDEDKNALEQLSRYVVTVVGDTTVTPKDDTVDIDKKIVDAEDDSNAAIDESQKTDTAAIGDVIEYEITGNVPNYTGYKYYYYVVKDTMSEGLTLKQDSFVVTVAGVDEPLVLDKDYSIKFNEDDCTFQLAFKNIMEFDINAAISIKYTATVNENAKIGVDANTNEVKLQFSNNPSKSKEPEPGDDEYPEPGDATGETPKRETKTYVTKLTLQKTDENGDFIPALADAEFTLTGTGLNEVKLKTGTAYVKAGADETATHYLLNDGTYTTAEPVTDEEADGYNADKYAEITPSYILKDYADLTTEDSGEELNITATLNEDGTITFVGLNVGNYTLEETKVPTGYNKAEVYEFEISATQENSTNLVGGDIIWASDNAKIEQALDDENNKLGVFEVTIENKKGNLLPSTGGMGTTIFYLIGTILVIGAGVLLVTKKRMAR